MSAIEILGWSLIHFLWQGAAIYLLLTIAHAAGRNLSANGRYTLCCLALLAMTLCPLVTAVVIHRNDTVRPSVRSNHQTILAYAFELQPVADEPIDVAPPRPAEPVSLLSLVVALWLTGSAAFSIRLVAGLAGVGILRRRGAPICDAVCLQSLRRYSARLGIRCPRLISSTDSACPAAFGIIRATISIPMSLISSLPADQLDALIAHELAHIRRYDYLINLWQSLVEALLFYHPAVWWVSNRIRAERELACDDLALELLEDRRSYARALASLESGRAAQVAVGASGGDIVFRIRRILGEPAMKNRSTTSLAGGVAALALLCGTAFVLKAHAQEPVSRADEVQVRQEKAAADARRAEAEAEIKAAEAQLEASRAALAQARKDRVAILKSGRSARVKAKKNLDQVIRAERASVAQSKDEREETIRAHHDAQVRAEHLRDGAVQIERAASAHADVARVQALQAEREAVAHADVARLKAIQAEQAARQQDIQADQVRRIRSRSKIERNRRSEDTIRAIDRIRAAQDERAAIAVEASRDLQIAQADRQRALRDEIAAVAQTRAARKERPTRAETVPQDVRPVPAEPVAPATTAAPQVPVLSTTPIVGRLFRNERVQTDTPAAPVPQRGRTTPAVPGTPGPQVGVTPALPDQPATRPRSVPLTPALQTRARFRGFDRPVTAPSPGTWARTMTPLAPGSSRILEDELDRLELQRINTEARARDLADGDRAAFQRENRRLETIKWKIGEIEKALARKRSRLRSRSFNPLGAPVSVAQSQRLNQLYRKGFVPRSSLPQGPTERIGQPTSPPAP